MTATDNRHFPSSTFITCSSGKTSHSNPAADGAINAIKNSKSSRTSTKNHYHLPTTHGRTQFGLNTDRFQCHSQNWLPSYVSFFIFPIFLNFLCLPKFPIIYTTQSRLYAIYPSVYSTPSTPYKDSVPVHAFIPFSTRSSTIYRFSSILTALSNGFGKYLRKFLCILRTQTSQNDISKCSPQFLTISHSYLAFIHLFS